ncbi:dTDP-4-dehydrorhamnose 3,5-epimerase [Alcanivorax sp.]|uniref:dTDP-4-dehydrorhamnose 3,5-epimerase n=1 Tax=Alcanivorax sp. TaxID=1872427 RepID=UPI0025845EC2|nr:dTDP-4-dehydrorhamnose 3,5-epimerase [Alcanivorax sp.]
MKVKETPIPGCYELLPKTHLDERGSFVKIFHEPTFKELGLCAHFAEEYYSVSKRHVLRGMHFQVPPRDHVKLVCCVMGSVMDVVVDLRKGSPTYRHHFAIELSAEKANMLYIPKGLAHGFCVMSDQVIMLYKVSSVYAPEHDCGIRWDTIGFRWPVENPVISERDHSFPGLDAFHSPFVFSGEARKQ